MIYSSSLIGWSPGIQTNQTYPSILSILNWKSIVFCILQLEAYPGFLLRGGPIPRGVATKYIFSKLS